MNLTSKDRLWDHMVAVHTNDMLAEKLPRPKSKAELQRLHGRIQKRDGKCEWRA